MAPFLQVLIAVVLGVLCAVLVPLLIQLRKTAMAVERFAESAREDLKGISRDIHEVRLKVDQVADRIEEGLSIPVRLGGALTHLAQGISGCMGGQGGTLAGFILTGLKLVFRRLFRGREKKSE